MLIESACSVDRVEEVLDTLIPLLPEIQYYRFNPGELLFSTSLLHGLKCPESQLHLFFFVSAAAT